ncbi:MAG TPA: DUF2169 domain-containing protein [Smithellaceae bacterium]|jgi:hypothetical protein|nr:DUF2169 domain-containing protein [Syntrophaceae bacterium]HPV48406.1 DUF2169 domain-containing protein [Smithellaceae bacterium]
MNTSGKSDPMTTLPIRYEYAFGGIITVYDEKTERDQTDFYDHNPIRIGYRPKWTHKEASAYLDTVFIDPEKEQVGLVWRSTILTEPEVCVLEARMIMRQDKEARIREAQGGR